MDELIIMSVTQLAQAIRDKAVSSEELVTGHLARIEAVNPQLNAVVQITADKALAEARAADDAIARDEKTGPLHGVPFTIKDSLDTAGVITTWGTPGRKGFVPAVDATAVARLKAAGAILLGKTNTPEFTLGYETDNPVYGRTNNPYDLDRTPGGSSGGAAAIIAAGGSPFDLGSDTGGSIRLPAHYCGITGIKPTSGRVPRTGHAISAAGMLESLTQIGPMARYVADLALILPIIAGPDGRDPSIAPVPLLDPARVNLKGLRAAFYTDDGIETPTLTIMEAVRSATGSLAEAGAIMEEKRPPGIEETIDILPVLSRGWDGGAWVKMLLSRAGTPLDETSLDRYLAGETAAPEFLVNLIDRWDQFKARMLTFMESYDLIIAPVNAYPAIPHGQFRQKYRGFAYTMAYNLTGWPAAVVRIATSPEGLPIGVQLVAKPWREDIALAAAQHLETALGGWERPPI